MPKDIPLVPLPLVEWLQQMFPDRLPDATLPPADLLAETYRRQGEQRVIRKLQNVIRQQEEAAKDGSVST